jgi:hypothetical protein
MIIGVHSYSISNKETIHHATFKARDDGIIKHFIIGQGGKRIIATVEPTVTISSGDYIVVVNLYT